MPPRRKKILTRSRFDFSPTELQKEFILRISWEENISAAEYMRRFLPIGKDLDRQLEKLRIRQANIKGIV